MKAISHSIKYNWPSTMQLVDYSMFLGYIPQKGYKNPHCTLIHVVYLSRLKLTKNWAANSDIFLNFFKFSQFWPICNSSEISNLHYFA